MGSPQVCVYCRQRPTSERWRPFCSERCKILDLAAWADGAYRAAGEDHVVSAEPPDPPDPAPR